MFKKVLLTAKEKKVIKKIARVHLRILQKMLNRDCSIDISLELLKEGLSETDYNDQIIQEIELYLNVQENPRELFNFNDENMSFAKHIMWNYTDHPKYEEGRKKVWRKMMIAEGKLFQSFN